jgi:hypothetical protein
VKNFPHITTIDGRQAVSLLPLSSPPNAKTDPHVEVTANEPESLPTACGQSLELYYVHLQKTDSSGEFLSVYY